MLPVNRRLPVAVGLLLVPPLLGLLAMLAPAAPAAAAPTAAAPTAAAPTAAQRFEETTQVVAVEVPVNVTDRAGVPVRGLTAADFQVFDDGSRQPITHFEVVDLDALKPDQSRAPLSPGEVATVGDVDAIDSAVRRHIMMLFELSFSTPTAIVKARLAAREFALHSLRPSDLVAVATWSLETGPRLVLTFTPDRLQLAHAIDTLGLDRSERVAQEGADPLRFILASPASLSLESASALAGTGRSTGNGRAPVGEQGQSLGSQLQADLLDTLIHAREAEAKDQREYQRSQITAYTRAMAALAKALDSVKGRKTIVYFSEGFDSRLLLGREDVGSDEAQQESLSIAFGNLQDLDTDRRYGNTELMGSINKMLEQFRRADCVIQAIDIGGLRAPANADATNRTATPGRDSLFYLANETGGELFKNANDFQEQLKRVLDRSTVTYLLAFQRSDLKADGAYHRLRVTTRAAGARLSYRTGYYAPRPFQQLDPLEKNLLAAESIASAAPHTELDVNMLVAPFRAGAQESYVPVIIEVGGGSILAGHKADKVNLEFFAYVSNRQGQMIDFFSHRFGLDVKKGRDALSAAGVKYYGHLDLAPGDYQVRVLVRDADSGRTGVRSLAVAVPAYRKDQPVLLPPLFMEARRNWVMVREHPRGTDSGTVVYPFTVNGEPYVPAARPEFHGADKVQLCLVGYNLGKGDLALTGSVTGADGSPLTGGNLALVERTATGIPGLDKLLATFEPTGLAVGNYVLRVALTDRTTGQKETNSLPFQVVR
jgi:VWFA-related protein